MKTIKIILIAMILTMAILSANIYKDAVCDKANAQVDISENKIEIYIENEMKDEFYKELSILIDANIDITAACGYDKQGVREMKEYIRELKGYTYESIRAKYIAHKAKKEGK